MCKQDLQMGRGRYIDGQVDSPLPSTTQAALPANPRRVALYISSTDAANGAIIDIRTAAGTGKRLLRMLDGQTEPQLLRIEDFGQLVTGEIFYDDAGTSSGVLITSISTQLDAPPIGLGPES